MRKFASLFLAASLLSAPLAVAVAAPGVASFAAADMKAGHYALDKGHANLTFRVSHMGFAKYTMWFRDLDAHFDYDPAKPAATKVMVTVNPTSIETGNDKFNAELAGKDWLDAAAHPSITFNSTALDLGDGKAGKLTGDLTLHGVTRPVTLDVTFNGTGSGFMPGSVKSGFSASGSFKRSDFGITKYVPMIGDDVSVDIEVEFDKK